MFCKQIIALTPKAIWARNSIFQWIKKLQKENGKFHAPPITAETRDSVKVGILQGVGALFVYYQIGFAIVSAERVQSTNHVKTYCKGKSILDPY